MRICFFNRTNDRSEEALCLGLHLRGHHVSVIGETKDKSLNKFRELGLPVELIDFRSRLDFKNIAKLKRYFSKNEFDLIYCPAARCLTSLMLAGTTAKRTKIVSYRGTLTSLNKYNPIDRITYFSKHLDAVVCNSGAVKAKLNEFGLPKEKLNLVYKGHDLKWYESDSVEEIENLAIPKNKFIIGYVANIRQGKGGMLLLDAIAQLKEQGVPAYLIHLGEIFYPRFIEKIRELGLENDVKCLGFKDDAIRWMHLFDLAVMPSNKGESFSRSIVEAMAQKVPVLSSNIGGMSELIQNYENGLLFKKGDLVGLVEMIKFAYDNPTSLASFKEKAYSDIKDKYNTQQYVDNYQNIFQVLINS